MSETASPSTYNEPTVMWTMRHRAGRDAKIVIEPMTGETRAVWFVNGHLVAARHFADWTAAIEWTDRLREQQRTVGWRISDDIADGPLLDAGPKT